MIKLAPDYYIIEDLVSFFTEACFPTGIIHRALNKNDFTPTDSITFPLVIHFNPDYDNDYVGTVTKVTDSLTIKKLIHAKKVEIECAYSTLIEIENVLDNEEGL